MKKAKIIAACLWLGAVLLLPKLSAVDNVAEEGKTGDKGNNPITSERLGGSERYLTYLSTDKPVYRGGEKVYLRVVVLEAGTNFPLKQNGYVHYEVKGPRGEKVFTANAPVNNSTAGAVWNINSSQSGGVYTVTSSFGTGDNIAKAERKFEIRAYQPPRLKTQIEFIRKGYGPGDKVQASVNIHRAEGGVPEKAEVTAVARVDGAEVFRKGGITIDSRGNASTEFTLPEKIATGDGALSFIIKDGGVIETAVKTIPILLQTMNISFYPEGGELIAGLPNKVYVQAYQPNGKPADISGSIMAMGFTEVPEDSAPAVEFKTIHEGRGYFIFTPIEGTQYQLTLNKPAGVKKTFLLPEVKKSGAVLSSTMPVYKFDEKITFRVNSTVDSGVARLALYKREKLLAEKAVTVQGAGQEIELDAGEAEGVLIATLYDSAGKPLAERLVMREPKFRVKIKITPEGEYVPGGRVKLNVESVDENGRPVEAVVGFQVTDESVLEMIDKREQAPDLPVMVYLENEVLELGDAEVYFNPENKDAARDVDLLLATQGWRRFILVDYNKIKKLQPEAAKRVLAENQSLVVVRKLRRFVDEEMVVGAAIPTVPAANAAVEDKVLKMKVDIVEKLADLPQLKKAEALKKQVADVARELVMAAPVVAREMKEYDDRYDEPGMRYVRVYAHKVRPNRQPNDRVDFAETLYWAAGIRTNARTGSASVEFDLSDSVTTFRVSADAFGNNGALGTGRASIESKEPFYIEPKMPQELTAGDIVNLPVALINSTDKNIEKVNMVVTGEGLDILQPEPSSLQANERGRQFVTIRTKKPGTYTLTISAAAGIYADKVTRTIVVKPSGFPVELAGGGLIEAGSGFRTVLKIPDNVVNGSLKAELTVYTSPLASMEEALNALLRSPYGCFEQTSSTTYPLVMAQEYFISHKGVDPEKIKKASTLLEKGYKRLIGFESKDKGYEWFGGNPAHEALTAYGLMEFTDMAKLMPVDELMLANTRQWLLNRRDGKGGFRRNERAIDGFGRAPQMITDAYIIWALLESGENPQNLQREIEMVREKAESEKDAYFMALAANIIYLAGDKTLGDKLAQKLVDNVDKDGAVAGAETSITRSGGESLRVETTSLAILAWLKNDNKFAASVEKSVKWLFEVCKAGRFGSTQSTILALKAINAYDKARSKPKAAGSLQLYIDGKIFGKPVRFTTETRDAIRLPDMSAVLDSGEHTVELKMENGSKMPYSFMLTYNTPKPDSAAACDLELGTSLKGGAVVNEGEPLEIIAGLTVRDKDAPTPIALIGVPAGLEPHHDHLKEMVKSGRISAYEIKGRNIILYWRALKAGQKVQIPLVLVARVPGEYTAPASRAYLYYTDELVNWTDGLKVTVKPAKKD